MERISIGTSSFPQRENPTHHLVHFGLLNLLVVGLVVLMFAGKATMSATGAPASSIAVAAQPTHPGFYGRTPR